MEAKVEVGDTAPMQVATEFGGWGEGTFVKGELDG